MSRNVTSYLEAHMEENKRKNCFQSDVVNQLYFYSWLYWCLSCHIITSYIPGIHKSQWVCCPSAYSSAHVSYQFSLSLGINANDGVVFFPCELLNYFPVWNTEVSLKQLAFLFNNNAIASLYTQHFITYIFYSICGFMFIILHVYKISICIHKN